MKTCMYLESPTLLGSSMCKIAVMVNEELSHVTTTVYSAATVHIHQLICLIVPSLTKLLKNCCASILQW